VKIGDAAQVLKEKGEKSFFPSLKRGKEKKMDPITPGTSMVKNKRNRKICLGGFWSLWGNFLSERTGGVLVASLSHEGEVRKGMGRHWEKESSDCNWSSLKRRGN